MVEDFKNTDAGIIPNDWNDKTLGTITTSIASGKSKTQSSIGGKYFIYGSTGIIGHSSKPDYEGKRILVARVGANAGTVNQVEGEYCVSDNTLMIQLKKEIDINYAFFFLKYSNLNKLIFGSGQPLITGTQLKNLPIPLPPTKDEQTAIATTIKNTDALIGQLEKLLTKKRNIKTGAMQELLKPKEDWKEQILGKVATLKARIGWQGLTTAEYRKTGNYFLITGTEFKNGFIDWESCFYVNEERYKQDKNIQVKKHDVLVTKDGTIGKIALIKSVPQPATLNSGVFVIRPIANSFHPEFFYYLLLSEVFSIFLSQLSAGSTISHLYQKDFVTFKFLQPKTIDEQKEIAKILFDMDTEIQELERKLEKYKMLKQGMMQSLLTGKIRLV
ncbi:restriction endonuclease subunit S [Flavobacterium sp. PL02]|uniref:restriction endonuclease subunit S n=1 Tax=Flavobacterium sp. PL02 TaxID=3088354 RepID=UPI002B22DCF7|nr:restriction endonuclease subunit S [Flavobacterium sp. PL02]MEA9413467.1 restriction endonuclease subunit S [Flavobacterium sp. PL02]